MGIHDFSIFYLRFMTHGERTTRRWFGVLDTMTVYLKMTIFPSVAPEHASRASVVATIVYEDGV